MVRINICRNYAVVVQQCWMREKLKKWVGRDTKIVPAKGFDPSPPFAAEWRELLSLLVENLN
jgi:hypothetical protein